MTIVLLQKGTLLWHQQMCAFSLCSSIRLSNAWFEKAWVYNWMAWLRNAWKTQWSGLTFVCNRQHRLGAMKLQLQLWLYLSLFVCFYCLEKFNLCSIVILPHGFCFVLFCYSGVRIMDKFLLDRRRAQELHEDQTLKRIKKRSVLGLCVQFLHYLCLSSTLANAACM